MEDELIGNPGTWQPPSEFGIGGPGEARNIAPGLVERVRPDYSGHNGTPDHQNRELYSVLNDTPIKPEDHYKPY